jgi:hypothetical protein
MSNPSTGGKFGYKHNDQRDSCRDCADMRLLPRPS